MSRALIWFRRDLRLSDNPALQAALAQDKTPLPVYIHERDPQPRPGAASDWWLHHSLASLQQRLRALGSDLLILQGDSEALLCQLAVQAGAGSVYWNRLYEPHSVARDKALKDALRNTGLDAQSFSGALLRDPREFGKSDGTPYRVFTPFWKALQKAGLSRQLADCPRWLPAFDPQGYGSLPLAALRLLPGLNWHRGFDTHWQPGEAAAQRQLQQFLADGLLDYAADRDRPALTGTARLSPHLHFGEITPVQIWHAAQSRADSDTTHGAVAASETFLRQVAWREFAHHLLFHFPHTMEQPLDERYRAFPWRSAYSEDLRAWQRGRTGIPIVDAGMRELWTSGWMHNRVRMLVASLLSKNLLIPWQEGAAWFLDTLVDADLANNSFGWQWSAGCGADAAPYFRIFNPVTQGERFDPDGSYVRRWVPELQAMPAKWIHRPWLAPQQLLSTAGIVPGTDYPLPIVALDTSRERALQAWQQIKNRSDTPPRQRG